MRNRNEAREIGHRVRKRRKELEMTQGELASLIGYKHKTSISKIENGVSEVSVSDLLRFAVALNTTTSYLLGIMEAV